MMGAWDLPTSLEVGGVGFPIRTDFRDILYVASIMQSDEFEEDEKQIICLIVMYPDFEDIPKEHYEEALTKAYEFISAGAKESNTDNSRLVSWEQDAPVIIPAINTVVGREIRAEKYMHWWTFVAAYMSISDSLFSSILEIRRKQAKGSKLEKYEREFYRENKALIDIGRSNMRSSSGLRQTERDFINDLTAKLAQKKDV